MLTCVCLCMSGFAGSLWMASSSAGLAKVPWLLSFARILLFDIGSVGLAVPHWPWVLLDFCGLTLVWLALQKCFPAKVLRGSSGLILTLLALPHRLMLSTRTSWFCWVCLFSVFGRHLTHSCCSMLVCFALCFCFGESMKTFPSWKQWRTTEGTLFRGHRIRPLGPIYLRLFFFFPRGQISPAPQQFWCH